MPTWEALRARGHGYFAELSAPFRVEMMRTISDSPNVSGSHDSMATLVDPNDYGIPTPKKDTVLPPSYGDASPDRVVVPVEEEDGVVNVTGDATGSGSGNGSGSGSEESESEFIQVTLHRSAPVVKKKIHCLSSWFGFFLVGEPLKSDEFTHIVVTPRDTPHREKGRVPDSIKDARQVTDRSYHELVHRIEIAQVDIERREMLREFERNGGGSLPGRRPLTPAVRLFKQQLEVYKCLNEMVDISKDMLVYGEFLKVNAWNYLRYHRSSERIMREVGEINSAVKDMTGLNDQLLRCLETLEAKVYVKRSYCIPVFRSFISEAQSVLTLDNIIAGAASAASRSESKAKRTLKPIDPRVETHTERMRRFLLCLDDMSSSNEEFAESAKTSNHYKPTEQYDRIVESLERHFGHIYTLIIEQFQTTMHTVYPEFKMTSYDSMQSEILATISPAASEPSSHHAVTTRAKTDTGSIKLKLYPNYRKSFAFVNKSNWDSRYTYLGERFPRSKAAGERVVRQIKEEARVLLQEDMVLKGRLEGMVQAPDEHKVKLEVELVQHMLKCWYLTVGVSPDCMLPNGA